MIPSEYFTQGGRVLCCVSSVPVCMSKSNPEVSEVETDSNSVEIPDQCLRL